MSAGTRSGVNCTRANVPPTTFAGVATAGLGTAGGSAATRPVAARPVAARLATPGLAAPGLSAPGFATPGLATPGLAAPGLAAPGFAAPGSAVGGAAGRDGPGTGVVGWATGPPQRGRAGTTAPRLTRRPHQSDGSGTDRAGPIGLTESSEWVRLQGGHHHSLAGYHFLRRRAASPVAARRFTFNWHGTVGVYTFIY